MNSFSSIRPSISPSILLALKSLHFETMTPVQEEVIPYFISSTNDILVKSQTGSGKTLAFLIPLLELMLKKDYNWNSHNIASIIISPTRELAIQIYQMLIPFLDYINAPFYVKVVVGGKSLEEDIKSIMKGCNILIGTPGRLFDILSLSNFLSFKLFISLIIDEADQILQSSNHLEFFSSILTFLPSTRRVALFSATLSSSNIPNILSLYKPFFIDLSTSQSIVPSNLNNYYLNIPSIDKISALNSFLSFCYPSKILLFALTCDTVVYLYHIFSLLPIFSPNSFFCLHRKMKQKKRQAMMERFRLASQGVLLCTDILCRGIDIPDVDWIILFDLPVSDSLYLHRIGRTARMGKTGSSLLLISNTEISFLQNLQDKYTILPFTLEYQTNSQSQISHQIKEIAQTHREIMEEGQKAFVSHVAGYHQHFPSLFSLNDWNSMAEMMGLLYFPYLREFSRKKNIISFQNSNLPFNEIPYSDPYKESKRLENLKQKHENRIEEKKERIKKLEMQHKQHQKRKYPKGKQKSIEDEWERLSKDNKILKKLKKRKISSEQFEKMIS